MADDNDWVAEEARRVAHRRATLPVSPPEISKGKHGKPGAWALALSGGGIRSATFALGVLQALAKEKHPDADGKPTAWLRFFDYLSTVSGGGYIGSFFGSLFMPRRLEPPPGGEPWLRQAIARMMPQRMRGSFGLSLRAAAPAKPEKTKHQYCRDAAEMAYTVLQDDPPGRVRSREGYDWKRRPLAWLRENGRYLTPTGAGDYLYAAALAVRNWLSLHYVIGTLLLLLFSLVLVLKSLLVPAAPHAVWLHLELARLGAVAPAGWSPLWALPLAVLVVWVVPSGIAFWLSSDRVPDPIPSQRILTRALWVNVALTLLLWLLARHLPAQTMQLGGPGAGVLETALSLLALMVGLSVVLHLAVGLASDGVEGQRVLQTRVLTAGMVVIAGLVAVALVDELSQAFYLWLAQTGWAALPGALAAALVWLVRKLAALPAERKQALLPKWLPLGVAVTLLALALLLALAIAWAALLLLVQELVWNVAPQAAASAGDAVPRLFSLVLVGLVPTAINRCFPDFINLSTLQAFYSARLTRAYLGASNGARFRQDGGGREYKSAAQAHPDDAIARKAYYDPDVLAPLHLINVTMDLTVDPTEQLVQRDRKGLPLAVGPAGYLLDGRHWPFREGRDDFQIGNWVGISGAALTTGLGRMTTFGLSLLLGLANVRMGVWWRSHLGARDARNVFERIALRLLPTQTYLAYELSARFHGRHRRWQYLSDGGHFENTAAYELLRPERDIELIVVCDDGCDPEYRFADLANLMRLARIDHRAHFELIEKLDAELGKLFGRDVDFARRDGASKEEDNRCALLYRVSYPGTAHRARWLIVLKPRLISAAPLDVWQYGIEHPAFPQESTADQFFDEAQWESYRKLGLVIGTLVFGEENGAKLIERLGKPA